MVDVGGYRLHINCQGEGEPTVVIESGMSDFSLSWDQVQKEVAKFTRVCTYDRAGLGWSERSPKARTAPNVVRELYDLLTQAGVESPYVFVGHSMGGVYVRLYAHEYPGQVAGMVLVDAYHEEVDSRYPEAYQQAEERFMQQRIFSLRLPQALSALGIIALDPESYPQGVLPPMPPGTEKTYMALLAIDSRFFETMREETSTIKKTSALMRSAQIGSLGDIPLIVLTAGKFEIADVFGLTTEEEDQTAAARLELQAELVELSSNGKQVIAEESGHLVQLDQPKLVVDAIRQVVEEAARSIE
jgi:pimeloyl-ACP methyl ester carboxylesterase